MLPSLFQLLGTPSIPWLVTASLQSLPVSPRPIFCVSSSSLLISISVLPLQKRPATPTPGSGLLWLRLGVQLICSVIPDACPGREMVRLNNVP